MNTLAETILAMLSENHKDRLVAEYEQVRIRLEHLEVILEKEQRGELGFELSCPAELLQEQAETMREYKAVLARRMLIELPDRRED